MLRRLAILFLTLEALGALLWWAMLLLFPATRRPFLAPGAEEAALLSFLVPDLLFFVIAAALAAWALWQRKPWTHAVLCLHAGAACYAALWCWSLSLHTGEAWLGTALMTPPLLILPVLVWLLRPAQ